MKSCLKNLKRNKMKKETLEEAAENNYPVGDIWTEEQAVIRRLAFKNGANDQAKRMYSEKQMDGAYDKGFKDASERMYSEEEVRDLILKFNNDKPGIFDASEWFEQFKKK